MAGITTPDTFAERIHSLVGSYVNAYVDLIDTHNNTIAGAGSDNHFTTPSVAAASIVLGDDAQVQGEEIRIIVTDEGERRNVGMQPYAVEDLTGATPVSAHQEMSRTLKVGIEIRVRDEGGAQTTAGSSSRWHARRVCNRVAEAVRAILHAYPSLSNPANSKAAIALGGTKVIDDGRADGWEIDSETGYSRKIMVEIDTHEKIA